MRLDVEPSLDRREYPFRHEIRVRFSETDAMGIVHHSRYLPYLEESRVAFLRVIGHPYREWRESGTESAVLEAYVRYRRPLQFDDVVTVHVALASVGRATFQMAYLLTVDDQAAATAATVHGAVTRDGRATRLPTWLAQFPLDPDRVRARIVE